MAKEKDTTDEIRTPRGPARRRREPSNQNPEQGQDRSTGNPDTGENPDWWRGDPGKRGEVL